MPEYLHWIVYLPFVVFCATAAAAGIANAIAELRGQPPALQPSAKIYYFMPAKTSLRSIPAPARENLRLVSNGG